MKNIKFINSKVLLLLACISMAVVGCDRDISDDAIEAGFPQNGDVFIDGFSAGLDYFPFGDSFFEAFSVDTETTFGGSDASMRFDVPNEGNPDGGYAGAIFRTSSGRDLSEFDALTFYAKGSEARTINDIGFGQDFGENKFQAEITGSLQLTTNWKKYIIPIPDPSKLTEERGLLWYAEGPEGGTGFSFWLDDVKFEKLGTIAQPRPAILEGNDLNETTFIGSQRPLTGLRQTFNLGTGIDEIVKAAPGYFNFTSSNPSVATVNELGVVNVVGMGTTVITATLGGIDAAGSLTLESLGEFTQAPIPDRDPENVISLFSDAYTNIPVDYYNGFFAPFQTTLGGAPPLNIGGEEVINYTDLNFVGVGTFLNVSPIDATQMTHLHVDINVQEAIDAGDFIRLEILNGVQTPDEISGSVTLNSSQLVSNGWASFDIALGDFAGLSVRDQLGLLFFVSDATVSNIYVDNIYYYKEVIDPSPNVDDSGATQVELPIGWESTTLTYDFLGFAGSDPAIEANPDPTGINPTANVMRTTKTVGADFFAGTFVNLDAPIDFSTSQKLRMKVWSPKLGIPIRVRLENADNSVGIELDANTTTSNEWEELEWDFSGMNTAPDYVRVVVFFEFIPGVPGDGSTYYYDDIQIIN
ncbi:carbohydrate-binding protein [uncultured Psychroserpens sp.]|uniref:carbohydrate-binding protein n=1 Tax=uncultured Psychroserpens sp. TaxID=255436 RepID=UPI002620898F|nr:carbohydrate-binding protein [uncultured Psychroserpens sp.]